MFLLKVIELLLHYTVSRHKGQYFSNSEFLNLISIHKINILISECSFWLMVPVSWHMLAQLSELLFI
jgi:hypothetical protein